MSLNLEYLWKDNLYGSVPDRPDKQDIILKGPAGRLFCTYYMAGGEENHPTVLLCHGYPGNEQNLDVAHALRRIGCNVMTFHYSGSWGSDGKFSFTQCIVDTEAVLNRMLNDDSMRIDKEHIYIFGHSMGGFVAFHLLTRRRELAGGILAMPCDFGAMAHIAKDRSPQEQIQMMELLNEGAEWLNGVTGEMLAKEAEAYGEKLRFDQLADMVLDRQILLLGGALDTITPVDIMIEPLVRRIRELGGTGLDYRILYTDHMFADSRCTVTEMIAQWLAERC